MTKFTSADQKGDVFVRGVFRVSVSLDGKKMLYRMGETWHVVGTDAPPASGKQRMLRSTVGSGAPGSRGTGSKVRSGLAAATSELLVPKSMA